MPKRSPWESYHRRQQQIDRKVFDLMQSTEKSLPMSIRVGASDLSLKPR